MGTSEMREIAGMITDVLRKIDDEHVAADVQARAADLCSRFTPYPDLLQ
jgi:glycine/serine hydroxymethyltransferase